MPRNVSRWLERCAACGHFANARPLSAHQRLAIHHHRLARCPWLYKEFQHRRSTALAYHGPVSYTGESVMTVSLAELDAMLDSLKASLPKMIADNPLDGDFWSEFAGHADVIEDAASGPDHEHVRWRIDVMLAEQASKLGDNV